MSVSLTKIELQQVLREMGVKFSHRETYTELMERYQKENHRRWLGLVEDPENPNRVKTVRKVMRKRGNTDTRTVPVSAPFSEAAPKTVIARPSRKRPEKKSPTRKTALPPRSLTNKAAEPEKKTSQSIETIATDSISLPKETILNRTHNVSLKVLQRANERCELCDLPCTTHRFFQLTPESNTNLQDIKNMVALCSSCYEKMRLENKKSDLSKLKRVARGRIISPIIERRPNPQNTRSKRNLPKSNG